MIHHSHSSQSQDIEIVVGHRLLNGILVAPAGATGIVLFVHGSGSGRFSSRNQYVAGVLQRAGIATLLFDLLDDREADDREKVFDIDLLAKRLEATEIWVREQPALRPLNLGLFGASTGAAAALVAAAERGNVKAVVSRGGRPDLAQGALPLVQAPTLLIVGGDDDIVVDLNRQAFARLRCEKKLTIIPGATHLFPEPGALEQVAHLATDWFQTYLTARTTASDG